ncbi:hypothetical protein [Pseudarthrobacter sp. IC2-21]|uniref:hypothetical protein n=1 Tax=Pseudarthrobacter sp. IC2-21 TaxID=3092262 RepID=UPI002A6B3EDF|nr:hypothetical protein [Pseudarthrobacter sp. IC2-21]
MHIAPTKNGRSITFDSVRELDVARTAANIYANYHTNVLLKWRRNSKSPYFRLAFIIDDAARVIGPDAPLVKVQLSPSNSELCIRALKWSASREESFPDGAVRGYGELLSEIMVSTTQTNAQSLTPPSAQKGTELQHRARK